MSRSNQSASAMGRPLLMQICKNFKISFHNQFSGWADGSQKPARLQAVNVGCYTIKRLKMKRHFYIVLVLYTSLSLTNCADKTHQIIDHSAFEKASINGTKQYIDSISHQIWISVPMHFKGRPIGQKGKHYYDERPVHDSIGNLKMYFVYNITSDTSEIERRFYYYQNHLIHAVFIDTRRNTANKFTSYYFRSDKPFCYETIFYPLISEDSVFKIGQTYLLNNDLRHK